MAGRISLVTTTKYDIPLDHVRLEEMLLMCRRAHEANFPVYVVDGSGDLSVKQRLRDASAHVVDEAAPSGSEPGAFGVYRRQAMTLAKNTDCLSTTTDALVWVEEKPDMVSFMSAICGPIHRDEADLVIPLRSKMGLTSYPLLQPDFEMLGNAVFNEMVRTQISIQLDMWVGVRAMNAKAFQYFVAYDGKYGDKWDSIFIPVMQMINEGLRVVSIPVEYRHSPVQTAEENANQAEFLPKRATQLANLVPAICQEAVQLGWVVG